MKRYDFIVQRIDNWQQLAKKLDEFGQAGYQLAQPLIKVGTKSYQLIMVRELDL